MGKIIFFLLFFLFQSTVFSQSISCGQTNCVPTTPFQTTVDIQEKATFSFINLNFLGEDLTISKISNQKSKDVRLFLLNGSKDDAKNLTIDLSSDTVGDNSSNLIVIGDNFNNVNLKLNGYNGKSGKDASEICAENITSLKYGAASNLKYLQNRSNPSNNLEVGRCGALDVSDLTTDKFSCEDPNFVDVTSSQTINVERVQKVSKCMAIIPQPICVQPAYEITCNYELWIKNINNSQGGGDNILNIAMDPERDWGRTPPNYGGNTDQNNQWKNNILTFKQKIPNGSNGMFFWDISNYMISTTYYNNDNSCGSWSPSFFNYYFGPYNNQPRNIIFSRSSPEIPDINFFRQNPSQPFSSNGMIEIKPKNFKLNQKEINDLFNSTSDDPIFDFCNANSSAINPSLSSKLLEVNQHISSLESQLSGSSRAYFRRLNYRGYRGCDLSGNCSDGCYGIEFTIDKYRNDFTFRARTYTNPVVASPGLDASGLRLSGGFLTAPNANAEKSYENASGWKLDIMKGFAGSDPQSSNSLLQKTCNTNYNLVSVESANSIKYEDILPDTSLACNAIQSCSSLGDTSLSCLLDPTSTAKFTYIGLDPDPQGRIENVSCTLGGSCPVQNNLTEDTRVLDTLVPTNGENGSEQGSGFMFVYDINTRSFQTQVGQAGAGGKNDLASPSQVKICAKKRDATTDPNSGYKNDPTVEFKRINWKAFNVNGGGTPGQVPQFTPKKIFLYKKVDPGVLYLLKKELL